MKIQIELPDKYAAKLEDVEEVEPTIRDQIEIAVLPEVLRLVNDAHRQVQDRGAAVVADGDADHPE
jgi:hypothetical protein